MKMKREVKIGLFALAMLLCLYLGINYLKGKDLFSGDRSYYALFEQTKGLQTSSAVTLRGVKVGSVTGISIDPQKADKVVVTVNIKKGIKIPVDSQLKLASELLGGSSLDLILGKSESYFEKNAVIPSETQGGLFESASSSLQGIVVKGESLINSLEATSNSLNAILEQNAESFKGTMDNLNVVSSQIAQGNLRQTLRDIGDFSAMLSDNSGKFSNIINNLDGVSDSLAKTDIKGAVDTLGMSISHLNSILADLSDGEGTGGKLLQDPALYDSLVVATGNLSALLGDLRENPKRYVHFSLFGRKDKEKKKNK